MSTIDFDFGRYIALRRGEVQQRARDGAAYSFAGERKMRRAMQSARPVLLAVDAASRTWRKHGKSELVDHATRATDQQYSDVAKACRGAATVLALDTPSVYVVDGDFPDLIKALGTDDDAAVFVAKRLVESLSEKELLAAIGHELAHIQNNHILYTTALYYLQHGAGFMVRWAVRPALLALQAWARRAEITCDRAALLCARDHEIAARTLVKTHSLSEGKSDGDLDLTTDDSSREPGRLSRFADVFRSHPRIGTRLTALRLFAGSRFYLTFIGSDETGTAAEEIDAQISEELSLI